MIDRWNAAKKLGDICVSAQAHAEQEEADAAAGIGFPAVTSVHKPTEEEF